MKTIVLKYNNNDIPVNFTGCLILYKNCGFIFAKNGELHRKGKPAIIYENGTCHYYKNSLEHREDGPSSEYVNGYKNWCYNGEYYGRNDDFTIESWKEKVKELKREEELKIFK